MPRPRVLVYGLIAVSTVGLSIGIGVWAARPRVPAGPGMEVPPWIETGATSAPPEDSYEALRYAALVSPKVATGAAWDARALALIQPDRGSRPNIVIITLETVGANHVGYLGYGRDVTPNLDRIAQDSLVYERAYSTATHSNYAQMAVLSSLFPRRGTTLDMYGRLDYPRHLMHDLAFGLGYKTATISSQDETWQGMLRFQTTETPTHYRHSLDYKGPRLDLFSEEIAPDAETATLAVDWIESARNEPFSLYVNFQSTHHPYPIPEEAPHPFRPYDPEHDYHFSSRDPRDHEEMLNRYDNALRYVDAQVGRIFDAIESRGLLGSTIFVVTADHGENFFDHDMVTHGRSLFDTEARVPLLVHYPLVDGRRIQTPVSTLDVVPTILDLLGLPPHPALQGESVAWVGLGLGERRSAIFMNIQGWKHLDAIVCYPYKLVQDPKAETLSLYDLERDPGELRDVATEEPEATAALAAVLRAQIDAQQRYHQNTDAAKALRADRYAPLMLPCPGAVRTSP